MTNDPGSSSRVLRVVQTILAVAALTIVIPSAWLGSLDATATAQVDAGLKRALVTFATARALNALISVAQGTEVAIQPAGLGVNLAPGQLLDPINDLIERFSDLMLTASVAFGVQKILITIGAYWVVAPLLTAVAIGWVLFPLRGMTPPVWLSKALLLLLIVRFAVPLAAVGSDLLYQKFMAGDYSASSLAIENTKGQFAAANPPAAEAPTETGVMDRLKGWWSQNADVGSRFEKLKNLAEQMTEHIIKLLVIFVMQTILLPLLLLWIVYRAAWGLLAAPKATAWQDGPTES